MDFEIGNRYKVNEDFSATHRLFKAGSTLTILDNTGCSISVESSRYIAGHNFDGTGRDRYCWNIQDDEGIKALKDNVTLMIRVRKRKTTKKKALKPTKRLNQSEFIGKLSSII